MKTVVPVHAAGPMQCCTWHCLGVETVAPGQGLLDVREWRGGTGADTQSSETKTVGSRTSDTIDSDHQLRSCHLPLLWTLHVFCRSFNTITESRAWTTGIPLQYYNLTIPDHHLDQLTDKYLSRPPLVKFWICSLLTEGGLLLLPPTMSARAYALFIFLAFSRILSILSGPS